MLTITTGSNKRPTIRALTAALLASAAAVAGAGTISWTATGALHAGASAVAGAGTVRSTGTGALAAQAAHVAGVGTAGSVVGGTGALSAQASTVAGVGTSKSTGTGALAAQAAAVAGVGTATWNTAYANSGGTGARTSLIQVGGKGAKAQGDFFNNLVDGATGDTAADSFGFVASGTAEGLSFDFSPTGFTQVIDEIKFYSQTNATQGTWIVEAFDGTSWTTLKTAFTLGGSAGANVISFTNNTFYIVYRLRQTGGNTSSTPWIEEVEFKIAQGPAISSATSYATGDRTGSITVTTTATTAGGGGTINNLLDGGFGANSTDSYSWANGQTTREIKFDLGSAKIVNAFKLYQDTFAATAVNRVGHGSWIMSGSNDDSTYVELGGWFLLDATGGSGTPNEYHCPNSVAYRYYKLIQTGGTTNSHPWLSEIEFKTT